MIEDAAPPAEPQPEPAVEPAVEPATEGTAGPAAEPKTASLGRRDANKRATRAALENAARELFAARGFAATTVRDIADAVGVTERTFFRYFEGKEELILDDVLAGLPLLQQAIRDRPAAEPPLTAVHQAVKHLTVTADPGTASPLWLFLDGPPGQRLGTSWRGFLSRIESGLAEALFDRLAAADPPAERDSAQQPGRDRGDEEESRFTAHVAARVSLAVFRSVLIRDAQLRAQQAPGTAAGTTADTESGGGANTAANTGTRTRPDLAQLFDQAFGMVT